MKKLLTNISISILTIMATNMNAYSQQTYDYTKNPYGLVYRDAIAENRPGEINIHQVN